MYCEETATADLKMTVAVEKISLVFTQVVWIVYILSVHANCTIFLTIVCNLFHTYQMFSSCHLPWNLNKKKAFLKHMFTSNCVNLASIKLTTSVFFIWFYPQLGTNRKNCDVRLALEAENLQSRWLLCEWEHCLLELLLWKLFSWECGQFLTDDSVISYSKCCISEIYFVI